MSNGRGPGSHSSGRGIGMAISERGIPTEPHVRSQLGASTRHIQCPSEQSHAALLPRQTLQHWAGLTQAHVHNTMVCMQAQAQAGGSSLTPCNLVVQALQKQHHRLKSCPFCPDIGIWRHYCMHSQHLILLPNALVLNSKDGPGSMPCTEWTVHSEQQRCLTGQDAEAPSIPAGPCSGKEQRGVGSTSILHSTEPNQHPSRAIWDMQQQVNSLAQGRLGTQPQPPCLGPLPAQSKHRSVGHPYGNYLLFSQSQSN